MEGNDFFGTFTYAGEDAVKRKVCGRCRRPSTVCLCSFLPSHQIALDRTRLHILQHPNEENRPLHTVAILKAALTPESYAIYKGRRFGKNSCPRIHEVVEERDTYLLYPCAQSKNLADIVSVKEDNKRYNLIILDGTWRQAASIYAQNDFLRDLCKVEFKPGHISEYVIRTQPTDQALSTVECVALALRHTERNPALSEILLKPLRGLCQFQLECGAAVHHSKEFIAKETKES